VTSRGQGGKRDIKSKGAQEWSRFGDSQRKPVAELGIGRGKGGQGENPHNLTYKRGGDAHRRAEKIMSEGE